MKYTKIIATLIISASLFTALTGNVTYAEESSFNSESSNHSSAVENAILAVNALFTDNDHTILLPTTTSKTLKNARSLLLKVPITDSHFQELYKLCNKAETLLNSSTNDQSIQKAENAVQRLFSDDTYTSLAPTTTSSTLKEARTLLLQMPVTNNHWLPLVTLCNKAEKLLFQPMN